MFRVNQNCKSILRGQQKNADMNLLYKKEEVPPLGSGTILRSK